jgi:hypothetical protein
MHAGGGTNDRGEKRNVLIVGVLLLVGSDLTLRSNTQRRIQILRVRQAPVLLHVAGRPKPVMGDAEVEDQTPAPGLTVEIVPNLHIAAPLARAGRHAMLGPYRVSGRAEQRPQYGHHPVARLCGIGAFEGVSLCHFRTAV